MRLYACTVLAACLLILPFVGFAHHVVISLARVLTINV